MPASACLIGKSTLLHVRPLGRRTLQLHLVRLSGGRSGRSRRTSLSRFRRPCLMRPGHCRAAAPKKRQEVKVCARFSAETLRWVHRPALETVATYIYWHWRQIVTHRKKDTAEDCHSWNCAGRCPDCCAPDTSRVEPGLSTAEVAQLFGVLPNTLRVSLCARGHYQGVRPHKRPNRLLSWPAADVYAALMGHGR